MRARVFAVVVVVLAVVAAGAFAVTQGLVGVPGSEPAAQQEPAASGDEPAAQQEPATPADETPEVIDRAAQEAGDGTDEKDEKDASREDAADPAPAEPEPEPVDPDFDASAPVVTETAASGVSVTAPQGFLATSAFTRVDAEIEKLTGAGHRVGVVMRDLTTGCNVSFNADERLYPASSIKATFCAAVCEANGGSGGMASTMENCLVNSSNEAFEQLIGTFGLLPHASWLAEHGAPEAAADADYWYYPDISAGELAACWQEIYRYGTSGEPGGAELAGYLARTNYTPIGGLLRGTCDVWAKPGWFPNNGELVATNDAGVVFSDCGPYVLVVMTDLSADLDGLRPLIDALNVAHGVMCGGTATSLL